MKPPPFDYLAPASVEEALDVLAGDRDARVLAGGQSLVPILNLRLGAPEVLVDIGRLDDLRRIDVTPAGLVVGANVTQQALLDDPDAADGWPLLAEAMRHIGHPQIRNRGTVCGSLAHNDPQAELPAVAVLLDAVVTVRSVRGARRVPAADLFDGPFSTTLAEDEIIESVEFPAQPAGWAFEEFAVRPGDFALAGVAATIDPTRPSPRVVVFGFGDGPRELGDTDDPVLDLSSLTIADDIHASAAGRRTLLVTLLTTALERAEVRARNGGIR